MGLNLKTTEGKTQVTDTVFPEARETVRTGTFILNSSLLNLKRMSESVRCRRVVGLRTRTSWRFPGKEPWNERVDGDRHLYNKTERVLLCPESIIHHTGAENVLFFQSALPIMCSFASHVKTVAQTHSSTYTECIVNKRMGNVGGVGHRPVAGTLIFVSFMMVLHE